MIIIMIIQIIVRVAARPRQSRRHSTPSCSGSAPSGPRHERTPSGGRAYAYDMSLSLSHSLSLSTYIYIERERDR